MFCYDAHSFLHYFIDLHLCHTFIIKYSHFKKISIVCTLYSCLRSFYCADVKVSSLCCFKCKYSIFFSVNFLILSRLRADLILRFLKYDYILLLRDIFKNDHYEKLSSSLFNFSFENEIISSNSFFID